MTERGKAKGSKRPLTSAAGSVPCSARNRFRGKVKSVARGAVNAQVVLTLPSGQEVVAIVTNESVRRLALEAGRPATVLVKASAVLLAVGEGITTSARNAFGGTVTAVREGAVNGEVQMALPGGEEITSVITNGSIRRLGIEPGSSATALVKASSVLLAVE